MRLIGKFLPKDQSERRRLVEVISIIVASIILILVSRLESRLFELSENLSTNKDFFVSVVYFGLINLNVLLIIVLSFLIFRNAAKLLLERRRGVLGSKLKTKLVLTLVIFALAPTAVLFYVSNRYIITSFDTWFSVRVRDTMQRTRDAGALIYRQDQKRLEGLAKIASERVELDSSKIYFPGVLRQPAVGRLVGVDEELGVRAVKLFDRYGGPVWLSKNSSSEPLLMLDRNSFVEEAIYKFLEDPSLKSFGSVSGQNKSDVVFGAAPIWDPLDKNFLGLVVVEESFDAQVLQSIEAILTEFANIRPAAQIIRLSFTILLVLLALIILFTSIWLGFYVARAITGPIQNLAEATREVALGNYQVTLNPKSDDETGQLIRSFNRMTEDLQKHRTYAERFQEEIIRANLELDSRRKYMEVVLRNISAGVISLDSSQRITSLNASAERLLRLESKQVLGRNLKDVFGVELYVSFWEPVLDKIKRLDHYEGQYELKLSQHELSILFDLTKIFDEQHNSIGVVFVFDDASEQSKVQKVAAWREVARRIAHEIKNPITPIKLSAQRLQRKFKDRFTEEESEVFNSCCDVILSQVESLKNMVNEFSKFSRLPSLNLSPCQVSEIVLELAKSYAFSYPEYAFETSEVNTSVPRVAVDIDQIRRALVNLINNAIEAMEISKLGKKVEFKVVFVKELNAVRIVVSDLGPGISAEDKEKVLHAYYSTKANGTGLGLNIVSQIVTDHGGYLRMVDNTPRGIQFHIELPALSES